MDTDAVVETPEPKKRVRRSERVEQVVKEEPVEAPVVEQVTEVAETADATPTPRRRRKPVAQVADTSSEVETEPLTDLPFDIPTTPVSVPEVPENVTAPIVPRRRRRTVPENEVNTNE